MKKLLILLTLISCSTTSHLTKAKNEVQPKWLQNPKAVYSAQLYLSAIGEGDSRRQAEDMAAANLSKIFESKIEAIEIYNQKYLEIYKNQEFDFEEQSEIQKNIKIESSETLFNIQFGESYTNKMGRVYVIAYLNRFETAQIYNEKILENAKKINYLISQKSDDILQEYAYFTAASSIANQNEILRNQQKIIAQNLAEELDYNFQKILEQTRNIAQKIGFEIKIKNDKDEEIESIFSELLTDLGFVISEKPLLKIVGKIRFEKTDLKRDIEFIRYEFQLQILNNQDKIIIAISQSGREGHISEKEAKARIIRALKNKIKMDFSQKITQYFGNLISKK